MMFICHWTLGQVNEFQGIAVPQGVLACGALKKIQTPLNTECTGFQSF
jgi:hypothetical protein